MPVPGAAQLTPSGCAEEASMVEAVSNSGITITVNGSCQRLFSRTPAFVTPDVRPRRVGPELLRVAYWRETSTWRYIVRVALAQIISGRDLAANLSILEQQARRAKAGGADMVVFPEASMRAFGNSLLDIAEPLDGPWASRVRSVAASLEIVVVAGMFTPGCRGKGAQHPARDRARSGNQLRQGPSFRRVRLPGVGHRGPGHRTRDIRLRAA